jgi:hypothetical protein
MRLMIDNTGFQSTGLAIEGRGRGAADVEELLQLSTLIVFAEQIATGGYEIDRVTSKTKEVKERLTELGLQQDVIYLSYITRKHFAAVCEMAAKECAEDIVCAFQPISEVEGRLYPAALPSPELNARLPLISRLLFEKLSDQELAAYCKDALNMKKAGAVAYMIASCPALRESVSRTLSRHSLSLEVVNQLDAFCRLYLNSTLASQQCATYTPAIARAQLIRRNNSAVVSQLGNVLDGVVNQLRGSPLNVPSVAAYLIQRSKGEPAAVIQEAIALREKTHDLRRWLIRLIEMAASDIPQNIFDVRNELKNMAALLEKDLGLKPTPRVHDAIEVSFILGIPAPKLSGAKLLEWINYRWKRRKVAVLTDLSKSLAFGDNVDIYYQRLVRKCSVSSN